MRVSDRTTAGCRATCTALVAAIVINLLSPGSAAADTEFNAYLNDQCIISDEPFYLPDSSEGYTSRYIGTQYLIRQLAQSLIYGIVKATIGRIGDSSARQDTDYILAKDVNLYRVDQAQSPELELTNRFGCITVVVGRFERDGRDCSADYQPKQISPEMTARPETEWRTERVDSSIENILRRANVCLVEPARAAYEIRVIYSDDGTAFRLETAGYWINRLLSSNSKRATRQLVYTLELHEPVRPNRPSLLSAAWADVGPVRAGDEATQVADRSRSDWIAVPRPTGATLRAYEQANGVHIEVYGKIRAIERYVARQRTMLNSLRRQRQAARPELHGRLDEEIEDVEFALIRSQSELEARLQEYESLPSGQHEYMPLAIQLGITEARSERRARALLAQFSEGE